MNLIKKWLIKWSLSRTASTKKKEVSIYDDVLKNEIARSTEINRMADKVLKAKLLRQQSDATLKKIKELDEDYDDGEEEADAPMDFQDQISEVLMKKLLGGLVPNAAPAADNFGAVSPQSPNAAGMDLAGIEAEAKKRGATPEQIKEFKEKMGV